MVIAVGWACPLDSHRGIVMADAAWAADAVIWDGLGLRRSRDPYTLRGVLRCARCGHRMHPVNMAGGGRRSYGCAGHCHGLVDAAVVERLVNDAVARHLPFGVPCEHRASFYAELLERVDIAQACALVFTWRAGQPASGREAAARPVMGAAR